MPIIEELPNENERNPFLFVQSKGRKAPEDFNSLSKEEQNALLDRIAAEFVNDPEAMKRLGTKLLQEARKNDFTSVVMQPQPGFVVKTKVIKSNAKQHALGERVYINICHSDVVPEPPLASEKDIQKALNADPDATYRVPLSLGQARYEKDAAGNNCLVMDACINTQPYVRTEKDLDYRLYILELSMEYVEDAESITLSREFSLPKLSAKGQIPKRVLRLPKPSLLSALKEENQQKKAVVEERSKATSPAEKPAVSIDKEEKYITVAIPGPQAKDTSSWTVDVEPSQVIVNGVGKSEQKIALPRKVNIKDSNNGAKYYKKSGHLVIRLALAQDSPRSQYL